MTRLIAAASAASACLLSVASGCSWSTFDELKDDLTVGVTTGPEDPGTQFGIGFAVPGSRRAEGARLGVLGRNKPTMTRLEFDAAGEIRNEPAAPLENLSIAQFSERPAFAGDPASSLVGYVALTNSNDTQVVVYDLDDLSRRNNILLVRPNDESAGGQRDSEGIAFAQLRTRAQASQPQVDVAFARRDDIVIIDDPLTTENDSDRFADRTFACDHGGAWAYGLAVGDVLSTSPGPEIVVGLGTPGRTTGTSGVVRLLAADSITALLPAPPGVPGPCTFLAPSFTKDNVPDLGDEILIADVDLDGKNEIIVSAPGQPNGNRVYVLRESASAPGTLVEVETIGSGTDFGQSIAVGDVHGDAMLELIVGAPLSDVDGTDNAGVVSIHEYDATTGGFKAAPLALLHDAQPENEQRFGTEVAVVPWGPSGNQNVVVVAAKDEVFTYFKLAPDRADVRTGR